MKKKEFARKLCKVMEPRIEEIVTKFFERKFNNASMYAFFMGLEGDIESFLDDNKLWVRKRKK
jgi:hypothetical protein